MKIRDGAYVVAHDQRREVTDPMLLEGRFSSFADESSHKSFFFRLRCLELARALPY